MPRDSRGPETSRVVLTNTKIGIFKENYHEDKLIENEEDLILEELGRVICGTPRDVRVCVCVHLTNKLVNGSSVPLIIRGLG
jgi:hypothetical protein